MIRIPLLLTAVFVLALAQVHADTLPVAPPPRAKLEPDAGKNAKDRLVELLSSSDPVVRQEAALALGKIGPVAREAVPALTRALDDGEWAVRRQAAKHRPRPPASCRGG